MERLTAFEFIAATDAPQLVRLTRHGVTLLQFGVMGWIGVDLQALELDFETQADLTIQGLGLGKPFWNGDPPSWTVLFNPIEEQRRLETIREMVRREVNRCSLTLQ